MRLVAFALTVALTAGGAAASAENLPYELQPGETLLEVEAAGEHRQRPDLMTFTAGIVTTAATAREAAQTNAAAASRLIEAIRGQGVSGGDMQTTSMRVAPQFERGPDGEQRDEPRIIGYTAVNRVEVQIRDVEAGSTVLDAMLAAGANDMVGPTFSLEDDRDARGEARRLAIEQAQAEAADYAAALGMRIGRVLRVSERGAMTGDGTVIVTGSRIYGTPIEPGEVETQVQVWVDYALVPR